jgi:hypothetical protein
MVLGLAACGPEDSNLDKETQEMDRLYQKNKETMDALAGDYTGTATDITGRNQKVKLRLRSFSVFAPNPNRIELIEIPNLLGFMTYDSTDSVTMNFNQGNFDKRSQTLRLNGTGEAGAFYFMELTVKGEMLNGEFLQRRLTSQVSLKKIND